MIGSYQLQIKKLNNGTFSWPSVQSRITMKLSLETLSLANQLTVDKTFCKRGRNIWHGFALTLTTTCWVRQFTMLLTYWMFLTWKNCPAFAIFGLQALANPEVSSLALLGNRLGAELLAFSLILDIWLGPFNMGDSWQPASHKHKYHIVISQPSLYRWSVLTSIP